MNVTTTSAEIAWKTFPSVDKSIFSWGSEECEYNNTFEISRGMPSHIYLSNLEPGTRYYYKVQHATLTAQAWFETNPLPDSDAPFKFAALGDGGSGFEVQDQINTQMRLLRPKFVIHMGDLIYPHGEGKHLKNKFFDPYHSLMNTSPFYIALGNHDYDTKEGQEILDAISLPQNDIDNSERFYTFVYGKSRFIALDSNLFLKQGFQGSPQWLWLEKTLKSNDSYWTIIFFHHPVFSSGGHEIAPAMQGLHALFARYGVDLVFSGHDHHYERTKIIDGIQYIITGGGGANVRTPHPNRTTEFAIKAHHFVEVGVTSDQITLKAINENGEIFDYCTLQKHGRSCSG